MLRHCTQALSQRQVVNRPTYSALVSMDELKRRECTKEKGEKKKNKWSGWSANINLLNTVGVRRKTDKMQLNTSESYTVIAYYAGITNMTRCHRREAYGLVNFVRNKWSVCVRYPCEWTAIENRWTTNYGQSQRTNSIFIRCVRGISALHIHRMRNPFNALFTSFA